MCAVLFAWEKNGVERTDEGRSGESVLFHRFVWEMKKVIVVMPYVYAIEVFVSKSKFPDGLC